ncbi:hypothetical protein PRN20_01195 [Devosia sp. ZB163]|uniref:hypothetical protein n=1 Tax=Devosia sp. ZB163 TaxID=3025938 RepID=UPI00235FBE8C|nr:hypothetical protein [Devosia sp. ZB163]MDC9822332.1 hypothetical protein [Devosia sp. ZB163]
MDAALQDAEERRQLAADLRLEARNLLVDTGLLELLNARFGEAVVTGSAGYDLMVWRDIDIHMPCEAERWAEWAGLGADIAIQFDRAGLQLHKANYLNDYVDPHPLGAGLYWGIEFRDFAGNDWKCDIWGWEPFDFAVRQARDANLRADLTTTNRDLILKLKHEARGRPGYYGVMVGSFDIYQFVLAGAGETLDELEQWKGLVA